jgi:PAS domain S-box-containing protein
MGMSTILIVDDNAGNLTLLRDILERHDYDVLTARHGAEALETAHHTPPDMIITDILMPVMDGFALCREWQQDATLNSIPFIFYTATYTTREDQEFGLRLGAARYLIKPLNPLELITILRDVLHEPVVERTHKLDTEATYLKGYSEVLIRKLESKVAQLEAVNRALEQEIAERKQAEKALQTLRTRYQLMFQKHVATMLLIDPDTGSIVDANQAACQYYGYSHDELVNMSISDINTLSNEQIHEEMQRAHTEQRNHFIFRHALASGDVRDVEVFSGPIEIEGKTLLYSLVHDITGRKRAQDALRIREEQYRRIFESVTDALVILDSDATITEVNPAACRIYGYDRAELIGLNARDLVHPDYHPVLEQFIHNIQTTGTFSGETVDIRKNGETFYAEVKGTSILFEGKPHLLGIVRDVTERKQTEQQRLEFEMEKERSNVLQHLISHASHDLRTPLTTIKTNIYLLNRLSDPAKQQRHLDILETQARHLERLLEDMLNMSRLDKVTDFKFVALDVNTIVQSIVTRHHSLAQKKNHTLTCIPDAVMPAARADPIQLDRALTHVVQNALHYTPDGGTITVRTTSNDQHVIIAVEDTGIGIETDDLPYIFDRFYRADKARSTDTGGAGLGLAISKRIVEAHQGWIEVESEPGVGSMFRIVLPCEPEWVV